MGFPLSAEREGMPALIFIPAAEEPLIKEQQIHMLLKSLL